MLYTRDRTETVSQVWLGMTTGCAVCHDHKFDPLSQREFYEMAAFFNNTTQQAMDGNIKDTPPTIVVPTAEDRPIWEQLPGELAAAQQQIDARRAAAAASSMAGWRRRRRPRSKPSSAQRGPGVLRAARRERRQRAGRFGRRAAAARDARQRTGLGYRRDSGQGFQEQGRHRDGSGGRRRLRSATSPLPAAPGSRCPKENATGAMVARMDEANGYRGWDMWLDKGRPAMHIVHKWPADALKVVGKKPLKADKWQYVTVAYDGSGKAEGVKMYVDGVVQEVEVAANSLQNSIRTTVPLKAAQRNTQLAWIDDMSLQDLRLYNRRSRRAK